MTKYDQCGSTITNMTKQIMTMMSVAFSVGGCGADESMDCRPGDPQPQNSPFPSARKRRRAKLC